MKLVIVRKDYLGLIILKKKTLKLFGNIYGKILHFITYTDRPPSNIRTVGHIRLAQHLNVAHKHFFNLSNLDWLNNELTKPCFGRLKISSSHKSLIKLSSKFGNVEMGRIPYINFCLMVNKLARVDRICVPCGPRF